MHIYLLPPAPHPHFYYALDLVDPYERVPIPNSWAAQLHCLEQDQIQAPRDIHALDKSSWFTAILDELVLDLASLTVTCSFIDGLRLQWSIASQSPFAKVLENVLMDLSRSQLEFQNERAAATQKLEIEPETLPQPVLNKHGKHKKQRSLLSSLFSGIHKLSLGSSHDGPSSSSSPTRSAFMSPPSPSRPSTISWKPILAFFPMCKKVPLAQRPSAPLSAVLQARARSALVDAFRRFVVLDLKTQFDLGSGYMSWAIRSMIRVTEDQMTLLLQEAGGVLPSLVNTAPPRNRSTTYSDMSGSTLVSVAEASMYDDDKSDELDQQSMTDSTSTETDGSSVHTPLDAHTTSPFVAMAQANVVENHRPVQHVPRSPSPPDFSPKDLATYTTLSAQCLRLRQLLSRMETARACAVQDEMSFLAVLEVKSRRRAWSNRAFMGGATLDGVGLAMPFKSSPLARCDPVTPEYTDAQLLEVTTGEHNISMLFPVSEEDEEDVAEPAGACFVALQDAALRDLEGGMLFPPQRPPIRSRTHSMHPLHHGLEMDLPLDPDAQALMLSTASPMCASLSVLQTLPPTALLFQPLKKPTLESQTKFDLFDESDHDGDTVDAEFTLSMDLPPLYAKIGAGTQEGWKGAPGPVQ